MNIATAADTQTGYDVGRSIYLKRIYGLDIISTT